jgi:hypothetical protein
MKDVFVRCSKKTAAQVCTKTRPCESKWKEFAWALRVASVRHYYYLQCIIVLYYWIKRNIDYHHFCCHDCPAMYYLSRIIGLSAPLITVISSSWLPYNMLFASYHRIKNNTDYCLFSQVKNKPWHFILKSGTVANRYPSSEAVLSGVVIT